MRVGGRKGCKEGQPSLRFMVRVWEWLALSRLLPSQHSGSWYMPC
jgi:hypothetical protein